MRLPIELETQGYRLWLIQQRAKQNLPNTWRKLIRAGIWLAALAGSWGWVLYYGANMQNIGV